MPGASARVTPAPPPATVLVVACDATIVARVEAATRSLPGWRVEVATLARLRELGPGRPDGVLVVAPGAAELRRTLRALPAGGRHRPVMALVEHPARHWTSGLRALGLRAVLPPRATSEEIAAALRAVRTGLLVVCAEALESTARLETTPPGAALTTREREILELMAEGASNRRIAAGLAISRHTAKFHVASILAKLGARSRTEAVTLALRAGLLAV